MKAPRQTIRFFDHLQHAETDASAQGDSKSPKTAETTLMELLINAEWRIYVLEHAIDKLIASDSTGSITDEDLDKWREAGFVELQRKYDWAKLKKD